MQSSQVSTDSNVNTSANRSVEKVGDGKYSSHSLDEVSGMIRSTISAYESKVVEFALALQETGCFSVVLECVLASVAAAAATFALRIPTIGIGTRPFCISQVN